MSKELFSISRLARDFNLQRHEVRTLIIEHEAPSDRVLNANVIDEAHVERLLPILESFAEKKARRPMLAHSS